MWADLFLSPRLDVQVSGSILSRVIGRKIRRKNIYNRGVKNPLCNAIIQIGFCFVTWRRAESLCVTYVHSCASCPFFRVVFFFEIPVIPLFYGCYNWGLVDISNLQVFSWLNCVRWQMCPLVSFLFHTEKGFYYSLSRVGKQAQESSIGALGMTVLFSVFIYLFQTPVYDLQRIRRTRLWEELWTVFFHCTWQKPTFHSTNIGWASLSAHREWWLWPFCDAICLLPRCGIKQM